MKIKLQWCVYREDPRYNGDLDDPKFNDGVLKERNMDVISAEGLKDLLLRFDKEYGVYTSWGWLEDHFYICYNLKRNSKLFEEDVKKTD